MSRSDVDVDVDAQGYTYVMNLAPMMGTLAYVNGGVNPQVGELVPKEQYIRPTKTKFARVEG